MREAGVTAFEFISARDIEKGLCAALFSPCALAQKKPAALSAWLCQTRADRVTFKPLSDNTVYSFSGTPFLVDGQLPRPAA